MAHDEQDLVDGWHIYSDWVDNLRSDIDANGELVKDDFKKTFMSIDSNVERFKFIWNDEKIRQKVEENYLSDLAYCHQKRTARLKKSEAESKKRRNLGNNFFKKGEFLEALTQYTQAVRYAPYPGPSSDDNSLALALANRSAALYSLTRYRLCLLDIELAMKYGYPEDNLFKLLIRRVKCLHILSIWANDIEDIKNNLKNMLKNQNTKEFVKTEISNMFEFIEQTHPEDLEKDELDVDDETVMKISNVSKSLSQAADCVEMSYDSDRGRYLITNKDVSFGRLLLAEEPFVCSLAPNNRDDYCYNCFRRLYSCGIGCPDCIQVLFCSLECQNSMHENHKYECNSFLDLQDKLGVAYLVTHIMFKIQFDLSSIPIHTKKTVDKKSLQEVLDIPMSDWPDLVYKNDYAAVLSLMDHSSDYDYDELIGFCLTATYLTMAFQDQFSQSVDRLSNHEFQIVIGSTVLKHLMQLQSNLISILDQNLQNLVAVGHSVSEMEEKPIGVGLYPTISLLNHSCSPNILSIFHRNKFIARAASSLECGTEINYCYGPSINRMSKKDRQNRLKAQYFFTCNCDCCSNSKENESRALLCPKCEGPVVYNLDYTHYCTRCKSENVVDVKDCLGKVKIIGNHLDKLRVTSIDFENKLKSLKDIEKNLTKLVYWRHPLFVKIKSELIDCAENLENLDQTLDFCKEELELINKTYGEDSLEFILTKIKLINFDWQRLYYLNEDSDDKKAATQDLKSLILTINSTRGKLKDLLASTSILGAESSFDNELKFLSDVHSNISKYLNNLESSEEAQVVA